MSSNTSYINPMTSNEIAADACVVFSTGWRRNEEAQRTWWVWIPLVGKFNSGYQLLAAMIEVIARGHANLAPSWDRMSVGGVWYDFDCASDIFDQKTLFGVATDDLQKRLEEMMASNAGQMGQKPALEFR